MLDLRATAARFMAPASANFCVVRLMLLLSPKARRCWCTPGGKSHERWGRIAAGAGLAPLRWRVWVLYSLGPLVGTSHRKKRFCSQGPSVRLNRKLAVRSARESTGRHTGAHAGRPGRGRRGCISLCYPPNMVGLASLCGLQSARLQQNAVVGISRFRTASVLRLQTFFHATPLILIRGCSFTLRGVPCADILLRCGSQHSK